MFLRTYIQYKVQRWYTFILGIALSAIHHHHHHHTHHHHNHRSIAFLSRHYYKSSNSKMSKKTATTTTPKSAMKQKENRDKKSGWIMKSQCRCGQCEIDILWNSTTNHPMTPKDTVTWDCHCAQCRIYHGSVFTSYVQVSDAPPQQQQVQIRKQTTLKHYRHKCDEIQNISSPTNHHTDVVVLVERVFCSNCYCKIATTATTITTATNITNVNSTSNSNTTTSTTNKIWYFNLGCIVDQTIRADYAVHWRQHRISKQTSQTVPWYPAKPKYVPTSNDDEEDEEYDQDDVEEGEDEDDTNNVEEGEDEEDDNYSNSHDDEIGNDNGEDSHNVDDINRVHDQSNTIKTNDDDLSTTDHLEPKQSIRGGCACGRVQYRIHHPGGTIDIPNELPICYCRLCRQMSGTAFVPWIYITNKKNHFQWITTTTTTALKLIRTTAFGRRHVCTYCGTVLTILYDEEKKDYIWPTAASIYDHRQNQYQVQNSSIGRSDNRTAILSNHTLHNNVHSDNASKNSCSSHPIHNDILQSVRHIYCQDNAIWYQIPKDGLPRSYDE